MHDEILVHLTLYRCKLLDNGPEWVETCSRLITENLGFLPKTVYLHGIDFFVTK
jgi:hypothetical protein